MISPQQCLAGQYCAGGAGSSYGTGSCPQGYSCGPGSVSPQVAPLGQFVGSSGSVLSYTCSAGTYAPATGLPYCLPCPPGFTCANQGTIVPNLCAPGTFRSNAGVATQSAALNSVACQACGDGSFAQFRGVPDDVSCEPCPAGRICLSHTGNITFSNACSEGFVCGEATTLQSSSQHACPAGFFCPRETTPDSVLSLLCPKGFACKQGTGFANKFLYRCPLGFFCPLGSPWTGQMNTPSQAPAAYLSRGQVYVVQTTASYCLRQIMASAYSEIKSENARARAAGLANITSDEEAIRLSAWTQNVTACVSSQLPYVSLLASNAVPVSAFVMAHADWHASHLLTLSSSASSPWEFSNKCILDQFPRTDTNTTWECLCSANISSPGALIECLTTQDPGVSNIGAPFSYAESYGIDDVRNCEDWPACMDWARLGNFLSGDGSISKESGPSTGAAVDDFDQLAVALIDYIAQALYFNAIIFGADSSSFAPNACPFATYTRLDGATSSSSCEKRVLDSTLLDPSDIIVFRVSPIDTSLTNMPTRRGISSLRQEDQRLVLRVPSNGFATITIDTRELPSQIEYGRDWRVLVFVNATLEPDANDKDICFQIWTDFLNLQASGSDPYSYSARQRDTNLTSHGCSWVRNPLAFEAFEYSTGSMCPEAGRGLCYFTTSSSSSPCNVLNTPQQVQELYLYALEEVDVRIEIQLLNGFFGPDRFKFINSVAIDVQQPSRAEIGTNKAFVMETNAEIASSVNHPFNLPVVSNTSTLMTRAFVSWLPRSETVRLTNCMRHTSVWEEFFYFSQDYFTEEMDSVFTTYIPYFSNCRGFGTATPLWFLLEKHPNCVQISPNQTVAISTISLGASSVGDACDYVAYNSSAAPIKLDCMVDEVPNSKQSVARWFESPTGTELFRISTSPLSSSDSTDSRSSSSIPVILKNGAATDGTSPFTVQFKLRYWQKSQTEKVITTAQVYFANFSQLTDPQSKGNDAWNYTLEVFWSPMSYIEVFNAYAFPVYAYLLLAIVVGLMCLALALGHWTFHWFMAHGRWSSTSLLDRRYFSLVLPPIVKGVLLALIPIMVGFLVMVIIFQAGTAWFYVSFYSCSSGQASSELGCIETFLDFLPSSWSGESPSDPYTYAERRNGRVAVTMLTLAVYIIMSTIKAFIPRRESRYYLDKEQQQKEEDRNWPPDQTTFVPLSFKRTAWFSLLTGSCIVCACVMQFSFSTVFTAHWWAYCVLVLLGEKFFNRIAETLLVEEVLKIPIMALFETLVNIMTLGAPNLYAFILTAFIVQTALLVDRIYIVPAERVVGRRVWSNMVENLKTFKGLIFKRGEKQPVDDLSTTQDNNDHLSSLEAIDAGQLRQKDKDRNDAMMYFLSSFSASAMALILTPVALIFCTMLYTPSQILNYYNVSSTHAVYYYGIFLVMFTFRCLADLVSLNTAENYHEWKLLDYIEYCRYRYVARPERWKGSGETADELITADLRSLDMFCFSAQFYFSIFLESTGLVLFLIGLQVTVNNAWNLFDDQATMLIIAIGVVLLGICKYTLNVAADYLKIWFVDDETEEGEERATEEGEVAGNIDTVFFGKNKQLSAPVGSALHGWPLPSAGDSAGWHRYKMAFLKENQLWLRAHMDALVDGSTAMIEFRNLLLESLAKLLGESNVPDLTAKDNGLAFGALPPHASAVRSVQEARTLTQGTVTELAGRTWLLRARFLRFLKQGVVAYGRLKNKCEMCSVSSDKASLRLVPEYPVAFVADQLRIQREFVAFWNTPLWLHFFSTFTPACSLCDSCESKFAFNLFLAVPVQESRLRLIQSEPRSCTDVLRQSPFGIPSRPLPEPAIRLLRQWHTWASDVLNPDSSLEDMLEGTVVVPEIARKIALFWLGKVRP